MGKFELWKDKKGEWRWNLIARNGQVIAVSEGYTTKAGAKGGIRSVRLNAPLARVVERDKS